MAVTEPGEPTAQREVDGLLGNYSDDHRHPTNQLIHWVAVPLIVWAVFAFLWLLPVPPAIGKQGLWAAIAMVGVIAWYLRLSRLLAYTMTAVFAGLAVLTWFAYDLLGARGLLWTAIAVFVGAWIAQFIGHQIEGRRPSFLTDLKYLLIGPLWLASKALRRLGVAY